jgi:hypothetical protein
MMATLRDLRYYDDQKVTDEKGNEVDLGQLSRNFSRMYDANTGEEVTNPNLQRYIDNPELADLEADIEMLRWSGRQIEPEEKISTPIKTPSGVDTQYEGKASVPGLDRAAVSDNPDYAKYQDYLKRVSDASQRLESYGKGQSPYQPAQPYQAGQPYQPQMPEPIKYDGSRLDRQRFKKMLIDTKFQGRDPLTFDPVEEVEKNTFADYQRIYEQKAAGAMGQMRYWFDLTPQEKQNWIKNQRAIELAKAQNVGAAGLALMKEELGNYEHEFSLREKQMQRDREAAKTGAKRFQDTVKYLTEKRQKDKDRRIELMTKFNEIEQEKYEQSAYPDRVAVYEQIQKEIMMEIDRLKQAEAARKTEGVPLKAPDLNVKAGSRTRGRVPPDVLEQNFQLAGGMRLLEQGLTINHPQVIEAMQRAAQMAEDAGYDTTPMPDGAMPPKQGIPPAQPKPEPDLYQ